MDDFEFLFGDEAEQIDEIIDSTLILADKINKKKALKKKKNSPPKKKNQTKKGAGSYRQRKARGRGRAKAKTEKTQQINRSMHVNTTHFMICQILSSFFKILQSKCT